MLSKIKGTQDFLDLTLFNWIVTQAKQHLALYNFQEVATPIIEPTELFQRAVGEHTDVVSKEMFTIQPHGAAAAEAAICLRPEHTAAMMRAYLESELPYAQPQPWKAYTWGPMFRYERPQKGRYRQFHQISLEIIGTASVSEDVLLISMLHSFFSSKLRLDNYALQLNFLGTLADRAAYRQQLTAFLTQVADQICETCRTRSSKNPLRIFDCKSPTCQTVYLAAPLLTDSLSPASQAEWSLVQEQLALLSVSFVVNPRLVRGLDYYNKTVFEFVSGELGAQNSFCGGGRYDQLATMLEHKQDYPAVGCGIGIERLMLLLANQPNLQLPTKPALTVVIPLAAEQVTLALLLTEQLHSKNLCVELCLELSSLKSMLRKASRLGAKFVVLIGADEQATHTVTLKHMLTSTEERVPQAALAAQLLQTI